MESTTSPADADVPWVGRVVQHRDFAAELAERRASAGEPIMPRNGGNRRTASKWALLRAIEDAGGDW